MEWRPINPHWCLSSVIITGPRGRDQITVCYWQRSLIQTGMLDQATRGTTVGFISLTYQSLIALKSHSPLHLSPKAFWHIHQAIWNAWFINVESRFDVYTKPQGQGELTKGTWAKIKSVANISTEYESNVKTLMCPLNWNMSAIIKTLAFTNIDCSKYKKRAALNKLLHMLPLLDMV